MLTERQRTLVRESFAALAPHASKAGIAFYDRLFAMEPAARPLFKNDIELQSRKLVDMLHWVVDHLEDPGLGAALRELGRRHAAYGATPDHYAPVGSSLIWMFQQTLGPAFTQEMEDAWIEAYALIAGQMEDGGAAGQSA